MREDCPICGGVFAAQHFLDHILQCGRDLRKASDKLARAAEDYTNHYIIDGTPTRVTLEECIRDVRRKLGQPA